MTDEDRAKLVKIQNKALDIVALHVTWLSNKESNKLEEAARDIWNLSEELKNEL